MSKEVLIKVENVSKKFCMDLKKSLWYGMQDIIFGMFGKKSERNLRDSEFWSVKDISFEVKRGECLGLIGHNGAGKSTLLKMLNGLILPDGGKIEMHGKIGALIELGAGFNSMLSGRENVYNNGAVLGFTKAEINEKFDAILEFSELGEFIDMPVQNYSSGMKVRLGFAIAAQMEPDILLIDEVLAVGDLGFVLKCFKQIDSLLPNTALIFVSHSMPMIARICNQIILMDHGKVEYQGNDISKGIGLYYNKFSNSECTVVFDDGGLELINYKINVDASNTIKRGEDLVIELNFNVTKSLDFVPFFYLEFKDKEQRPVAGAIINQTEVAFNSTTLKFEIIIKNILFSLGIYSIDLSVQYCNLNKTPLLRINNFITFQVESKSQLWVPIELESEYKVF